MDKKQDVLIAEERNSVEERPREMPERCRTILESIEDGYFESDMAGNFLFINDSLGKIVGYSRDELMDINYWQCTDEKNREKIYEAFNMVYRTGQPERRLDWEVIKKDGMKRIIELSISLIKDKKEKARGFCGIARDVTEIRCLEQALRDSE
jgi:PAS domain S-box-containing protein